MNPANDDYYQFAGILVMEIFSLFLQLIYLVNRQTSNVGNQQVIQPFYFHFTGIGYALFFTAFKNDLPRVPYRVSIYNQKEMN